jgi:glycosyltransferase involved in cell wall biosynthesis
MRFSPTCGLCEPAGRFMAQKLRIGIDARAAAEVPAGRGRYTRELLRALPRAHDYVLYAREPWDGVDDLEWRLIDAPDPLWHVRTARAASRECDVLLSTNSYLTAWFTRVPTVCAVMDLIAWLPEMNPQRRAAVIEKATIRPALRRAAALACISEATKRDLVERFPAARGKSVAIPLAASPELFLQPSATELDEVRERLRLPDEFVLATGTLEPRKNLPRLIQAHAALGADAPPLVLAGPPGWQLEEALAGASDRPAAVRLLGYVSEGDLRALYRLCTVFGYPSLYEGFGLPLLEAMACGAPCLTSDVSSLPEVGGDAVMYADPLSVESIRSGLERLLSSEAERRRLGLAAIERAHGFSWERTARETLDVLERAAQL